MLVNERLTSNKKKLVDGYSRHIHKLRVQLTDACNFRCFYCMPKDIRFLPKNDLLTPEEIFSICSILNDFGIDEIRITGGEPTLRTEFNEIISRLSELPLSKLGLTTNGFFLTTKLRLLKEKNCQHLNISMDSLQKDKFNRITRSHYFPEVYSSILNARESGFRVKVNVVLCRGVNDDEIDHFIEFSARENLEVRFLELMKIGPAYEMNPEFFISAAEVIGKIKNNYQLQKIKVSDDSTSFNYLTDNGARIGFIASESQPFCGSCSRLRLSATGKLRACLMSEAGIDLKNRKPEDYQELINSVMALKPPGRINHIEQPMNQIGG